MKTLNYRSKTRSALATAFCTLALSSAAALLFSATAFADVVVEWNSAMTGYSESQPPPGIPPYIESRIYAMAHLAVLDAIAHGHNYSAEAAVAQRDRADRVAVVGVGEREVLRAPLLALVRPELEGDLECLLDRRRSVGRK